jgi:hypothetical protein
VKYYLPTSGFYTKGDFDVTYLGNRFRDREKEEKFVYSSGGISGLKIICFYFDMNIFNKVQVLTGLEEEI